MPNTFEEQAKDRFRKSHAFMQKANTLLQDDLVYRSALADAVSSIKNMLQGYLLLRVARTPDSMVTQHWQEVAASNRMPDLIQACGEAGLDLRGLAVEIKRLNNERNYRTHDDPQRLVNPDQAAYALDLAQTVQKRIRAAVQGGGTANSPTPAMPAAYERQRVPADAAPRQAAAAPSPSLPVNDETATEAHTDAPANGRETQPTAPDRPPEQDTSSASMTAQPGEDSTSGDVAAISAVESQEDDDPLSPDEAAMSLPVVTQRRGRFTRALLRALIAAVLLVAGAMAGAGLALPVATGHVPAWLPFATQLLPARSTPSPTLTPIPTAVPTPTSGPVTVGALTIQIAPCQAGVTTLTLHNTGATSLRWALGSPDTSTPAFAVGASAPGAPTQFGTLAAAASVSITASAPGAVTTYHVVEVAPEGTVQLLLAAC